LTQAVDQNLSDTLLALAFECERVTEGSADLDHRISLALDHYRSAHIPGWVMTSNGAVVRQNEAQRRFTRSFDEALHLVPKGYLWLRQSPTTITIVADTGSTIVHDKMMVIADGATPALALTAAALMVRSRIERSKDATRAS
jgi:hypothetical protein